MSPCTSASVYATARTEGRAALVGYQPAGFPSYDGCVAALTAMVSAGVDIVEIGLPYSDPVLDGPTIQAAADIALHNKTRTTDVLRTVEAVAATHPAILEAAAVAQTDEHSGEAVALFVVAKDPALTERDVVEFVYPLSTQRFTAMPIQRLNLAMRIESREPIKSIYSPIYDTAIRRDANRETIWVAYPPAENLKFRFNCRCHPARGVRWRD